MHLEDFALKRDETVTRVTSRLQVIIQQVKDGNLDTSNGVSLLELKYQTLMSYLTNYSYYLLMKSKQLPVVNHPVINQLIELRVYIEKMKPLEHKIRYQIDKLVKNSVTQLDASNPLSFKPQPLSLEAMQDGEDVQQHEEHSDNEKNKNAVYKPPKIAPMYFAEKSVSKSTHLTSQQLEKASRSRLLTEMKSQYSTLPEETNTSGTGYARRDNTNEHDEKWNERQEFEESNFMRLNMTKADKRTRKIVEKGTSSRFNDEFMHLEEDFKMLGGVKHAVGLDDMNRPRGILRKTQVRENERDEKYKDIGDMANRQSSSLKRNVTGQDQYGKDVKRMKSKARKIKNKK